MKKRIIGIFITVVMLVGLMTVISISVSAEEPTIESSGTWGGIDWTLTTDGTLTIAPTKGTPVPDINYGKYTFEVGQWREAVEYTANGGAKAIGGWPYDRSKVKKLIIEEGVTYIGSFAAQNMTNLTGEVVIPSTVTYIGQEAFMKSTMEKLTFAEGGTEELCIAPGAFKNLIIEEVSLPDDRPVHIHAWIFNNCHNLKKVTFPATLTSVTGTHHTDYNHNSNAQTGGKAWDSLILAYDENLETVSFGSEEVRDMFFQNDNGKAKDFIQAYVGLTAYSNLQDALDAAAESGETVNLVKNVYNSASARPSPLPNSGGADATWIPYTTWVSSPLVIPEGVTLNLNGKTLTNNVTLANFGTIEGANIVNKNESLVFDSTNAFHIIYELGDGETSVDNPRFYEKGDESIELVAPEKSGHEFTHWTTSDADIAVSDGELAIPADYDQTTIKLTANYIEAYEVWVGGVRVTVDNEENLAEAINDRAGETVASGEATFARDTYTLTLKNFVYTGTAAAFDFKDDLVLNLVGRNEITVNAGVSRMLRSSPVVEYHDLTIQSESDAQLLINSTGAITVHDLTIDGVNVTLSQVANVTGNLTVNNSEFICGELTVAGDIEIRDLSVVIAENGLPKKPTLDRNRAYKVYAGSSEETSAEVDPGTYDYSGSYVKIIPICTVIFDYGTGHSEDNKEFRVIYKECLDSSLRFDVPTIGGLIFMGWYTDGNFTTEFDFASPILGDTTIYAKYAALSVYDGAIDTLKTDLDAVAERLEDLKTDVETNASDIASNLASINGLNDSVKKLGEDLEALATELRGKDTELEQSISDLETALQALSDELDTLTNRVTQNETEIDNLKEAVDELEYRIEDLEDQFGENGEIAKLKEALDLLKKALDKLTTEDLAAAISRIKALENAVEKLESTYATKDALDGAIAVLTDLINNKADADDINQALRTINEKLGQIPDGTDISSQITSLNAALTTLAGRVSANENSISGNTTDILALQNTLANLGDALEIIGYDSLADVLTGLDSALDDLYDRVDKNEEDISNLQTDLQTAIESLEAAMKSGDSSLSREINSLDSAISTAKATLRRADAQLKEDLTALINEADKALDDAIKTVQKNLDDAKAELEKAIADGNAALDDKITELVSALEAAVAALEAADETNKAELESKLSDAQTAIQAAIDKSVSELTDAIASNNSDLSNKIAAIDSTLKAAKTALNLADADLMKKIEDAETALDDAIKTVQKNLDDAKAELDKAIANGDAALDDKIEEVSLALASAKAALEAADATNMSALIARIEDAYASLDSAIRAVVNSVDELKAQLEERDDDLQTVVTVVGSVSGLALCGSGAFILWFFLNKKKWF